MLASASHRLLRPLIMTRFIQSPEQAAVPTMVPKAALSWLAGPSGFSWVWLSSHRSLELFGVWPSPGCWLMLPSLLSTQRLSAAWFPMLPWHCWPLSTARTRKLKLSTAGERMHTSALLHSCVCGPVPLPGQRFSSLSHFPRAIWWVQSWVCALFPLTHVVVGEEEVLHVWISSCSAPVAPCRAFPSIVQVVCLNKLLTAGRNGGPVRA